MLPFLEACDPSMLIIRLLQAWPVLQVIAESIPSRFQYGVDTRLKQITETLSLWSLVENWIYFSLNLNKMWRAERILLSVLLNLKWQMRIEFLPRRRPARSSWGRRFRNKMFWQLSWGHGRVLSFQFQISNGDPSSILISGTFTGFADHGIPFL